MTDRMTEQTRTDPREPVGADGAPRGLSASQVRERVRQGLTNAYREPSSRSAAAILRTNLLTVFNAILGVAGALACVIGWGSEAVILTWGMRDEAVDNEVALQIRETTSAVVYLFIVAPIAGVFGFTLHSLAHLSAGVVTLAGLAGTASYLFYYKALSAIGASRGMALNISYSAWAIIFALVLQGTVPTATQVVCCIVILVGTVLAATPSWGDLLPRRAEKVSGQ